MFSSAAGLSGTRNCIPAVMPAGTITLTSAPVWGFLTLILLPGPAPAGTTTGKVWGYATRPRVARDTTALSRATRPRVVGGIRTHSPFGRAGPIIGAVVILGLVLWSCYCCESCPMYDHWNPRAKEKRIQNLQQPIIGGTYQQPTQVGTVVP